MQKDCWEQSLPCRSPAPAALVHLTSKDGGNAERLLGTIPAMHVRTILAMWVGFSQVLIHSTIELFNSDPKGSLLNGWRRGRSLSPIHGLRDTCTSMCNGILTSSHPSYHRTIQQWSLGITVEWLAEREGFEPPDGCPSTVFKTAAFNHSATSPELVCRILSST